MSQTSSKADTLVKVVLVFFISLLSFSIGTFMGKQVADHDHEVFERQHPACECDEAR